MSGVWLLPLLSGAALLTVLLAVLAMLESAVDSLQSRRRALLVLTQAAGDAADRVEGPRRR